MKIAITCSTGDFLDLHQLTKFQGKLKFRDEQDVDKVKKSIIKYGFSFPFFVWKNKNWNYILDGHGRELALNELEKEGYEIPPLPVVYITAENDNDAKEKLLRINSRFGDITNNSFVQFSKGMNFDFKSIDIRFEQELKEIKPVVVKEPIKTTIDHMPTFADSSPSEATINEYNDWIQEKVENDRKAIASQLCSFKCPCCGKTMSIKRDDLLMKIGGGW
ncbi:ParB-like nuclease domain-containing protein [Treponema bryantii]|uniref:ParB-like nuclease domain-containing protein n=1 Tax=Treponema bryantii TaxID=163 RepID=A0A1H9AWP5_9SPIR|nr:ParB N-terminal domain-containing protein [Treponema bryantii]SEP80833.1 ParB-like nuclease domain-containing protein [Treponema bryantii]